MRERKGCYGRHILPNIKNHAHPPWNKPEVSFFEIIALSFSWDARGKIPEVYQWACENSIIF